MLRGADLIFGGGAKALPYDAEVEYIQSTGTQFIDTGIRMTSTLDSLRVKYVAMSNDSEAIAGASRLSGELHRVAMWNSYKCADISNSAGETSTYRAFVTAQTIGAVSEGFVSPFRRYVSKNGIVENQNTAEYKSTWETDNIYLCWANGGLQNKSHIRLIEAEIKRGDTVLFSAVAVRFTNELGISEGAMYDKVSGQLFRNQGTGAFVVGPDKGAPYLRRVAFLKSDGKQWINTNYIPTALDTIKGTFLLPVRPLAWQTLFGSMTDQNNQDVVRIQERDGALLFRGGMGVPDAFPQGTVNVGVVHSFEMDAYRFSIDNRSVSYTKRFVSSTHPIYLFTVNTNGVATIRDWHLQFYSFVVSRGGFNVLNLTPVLDLSGRPAMYDEVSGRFFYNQGEGEFTWGELT